MKQLYILLLVSFCIVSNSCNKKADTPSSSDTNFLTYSIEGQNTHVNIDPNPRPPHKISIIFPGSVTRAGNLVADFILSPGCKATVNNTEQISGVSKNDCNASFTYTVSASSPFCFRLGH
ncbi:MAG: hypothetical protein ABI863_01920 [Ginsengibacter sp.]